MIGVYDFCGHYDWTFEWFRRQGGEPLVRKYWDQAIRQDAQRHAAGLIGKHSFAGTATYWSHTLQHEGAGYHTSANPHAFRIDMHECPSKGFLIRNDLSAYHDYCDHCIGWIEPMLESAGFAVDHEHNHRGQCWWEIRRLIDRNPPTQPGALAGQNDVRLRSDWRGKAGMVDCFHPPSDPEVKARQ